MYVHPASINQSMLLVSVTRSTERCRASRRKGSLADIFTAASSSINIIYTGPPLTILCAMLFYGLSVLPLAPSQIVGVWWVFRSRGWCPCEHHCTVSLFCHAYLLTIIYRVYGYFGSLHFWPHIYFFTGYFSKASPLLYTPFASAFNRQSMPFEPLVQCQGPGRRVPVNAVASVAGTTMLCLFSVAPPGSSSRQS